MLIFFIHGVTVRDANYANNFQSLLEQEFSQRQERCPICHPSFWGNVYRELVNIWHKIEHEQDPLKHTDFRK